MTRLARITVVLFAAVLASCNPEFSASDEQPTEPVVYVTPTKNPTRVPTLVPILPSPTPTITPIPVESENQFAGNCEQALLSIYRTASEACVGRENGFLCNGNAPSVVRSQGELDVDSLAVPGGYIETNTVDLIESAGLLESSDNGGLVWLRSDDSPAISALLIGDVTLESRSETPWEEITVETQQSDLDCASLPLSMLVLQSSYGQNEEIEVNGVNLDLSGTVVIQTEDELASFLLLEGFAEVAVLGETREMVAGQQVDFGYNIDDYHLPTSISTFVQPLNSKLIDHLPIMLLDRPVLLPQPGFVETHGLVNMRAEPELDAQLLYQIPAGEVMSVLGKSPDGQWFHTRLGNGETGWMKADLLSQRVGAITQLYELTPTPPSRYHEIAETAVVSVPYGSNLRSAPDTYFDVIVGLPQGTEVTLLERSPYSSWVKVDYEGQVGWVAMFTLQSSTVFSFLPVDYDVAYPPIPTAAPSFSYGGGHAYPDPGSGY